MSTQTTVECLSAAFFKGKTPTTLERLSAAFFKGKAPGALTPVERQLPNNTRYSFVSTSVPKASGNYVYHIETTDHAKIGKHSGTLSQLVSRYGTYYGVFDVVAYDCDGHDYTSVEKALLVDFKTRNLSTVREQVKLGTARAFDDFVQRYLWVMPRTEKSTKKAYQLLTDEYKEIHVHDNERLLLAQAIANKHSNSEKFVPFTLQIHGKKTDAGGYYTLTPVETRERVFGERCISRYCRNSKITHETPCVYFKMSKNGITQRCKNNMVGDNLMYCACKDFVGETWKLPEGLYNHFFQGKIPKTKKYNRGEALQRLFALS
jgi:hypothetical protein